MKNNRILCLILVLCMLLPLSPAVSAQEAYGERQMLDTFVAYMNDKAAAIGMADSIFHDPVGLYNYTTARDFLQLMIWASRYPELMQVWEAKEHTFSVDAEVPRQQTVVSTIRGSIFLDPYYEILGCKDGELPAYEVRNLAAILQVPDSEERLVVVALCAYGERFYGDGSRAAVKQVADLALARYRDPDATLPKEDVCCRSAIAALIPEEGAQPEILYEKNADLQILTASIAKVLTAVCLLDVQQDLEETFAYHTFDTEIGGFYTWDFYPGDVIRYRDGLYALLLPSSNVTARALAREAGCTILEAGAPDPAQIPNREIAPTLEGCVAAMAVSACAAAAMEDTDPEPCLQAPDFFSIKIPPIFSDFLENIDSNKAKMVS